MPREDVPYPGRSDICSIRERIAQIEDELQQMLRTINGVAGDGAGELKILSGSAALTVNNDQLQNEITIGLDTTQLPAADVNSVNGQQGSVVLDASDIGSTGGSDVQSDIDALKLADTGLQTNINNEALARQGADATLQNNINAALATIPGEVASQIANDATIAQLVTADTQNVKLTGAQNVAGVKTFSSIPLVPTAANGSADQSAANTNWISQTGSGRPNNLIHSGGDETKTGNLHLQFPNTISNGLLLDSTFNDVTAGTYQIGSPKISWYDKNGVRTARLHVIVTSTGVTRLELDVRNSDGTTKTIIVGSGDVI